MKFLCISVFFVLYLSCVSGLYFHIAETERKCFIEEIPDETMVIGKLFTADVFVQSLVPTRPRHHCYLSHLVSFNLIFALKVLFHINFIHDKN